MRWSSLRGQQWGGATLPLFHEGNFHNVELKVCVNEFVCVLCVCVVSVHAHVCVCVYVCAAVP